MNAILSFDRIKMRRSGYWGVVLLFPTLLIIGNFLFLLLNMDRINDGTKVWGILWFTSYYIDYVAIHLVIALLAAILANMEHQTNTWKLIFSAPVSKGMFYWVKVLWLILGVLTSGLILMVGFGIVGFIFGGAEAFNPVRLFSFTLYPFLTGFALMGVQLWLSMVMKNQSVPIVAGGVGVIVGLYGGQIPGILEYLPWVIPYQILFHPDNLLLDFSYITETPQLEWSWVFLSLLMGLLFFVLGSVHFSIKEEK